MPDQDSVEIVVAQPTAIAQMEKIQIDSQIATAKQYPRDVDLFIEKATKMVTCDVETAASCTYRRPVGQEGGQMKFAEGASIRAAEIVAASYGNIKIQCMITDMQPKHVKAISRVLDMENNIAVEAECVESTVTKQGKPFSERMRVVVAKACMSKARRDALFMVIPRSLCKPILAAAEKVATGEDLPKEERLARVSKWIVSLGIDPNRIWKALGINGLDDLEEDHFKILFGTRTALKDGECTIDEAFPGDAPQTTQAGVAGVVEAMKGKKKDQVVTEDDPLVEETTKDMMVQETKDDDGAKEGPQADPTQDQPGSDTTIDTESSQDEAEGPDPTPAPDAGENKNPQDQDTTSATTAAQTSDDPAPKGYKCKCKHVFEKPLKQSATGKLLCPKCYSKEFKPVK